jgi:hypothetical protein
MAQAQSRESTMSTMTIIRTTQPSMFAGLVAASGIGLAPFTAPARTGQGAAAANSHLYVVFSAERPSAAGEVLRRRA